MKDDIKKIISDGTLAPSGENCQPWRFIIKNNEVHIFNIPDADTSLYNFNQRGSYFAHGALLENISISALHYGYKANINLFPDSDQPDLISIVTLDKVEPQEDDLYPFLKKRCTNRKDYNGQKLNEDQKKILMAATKYTDRVEFIIKDDGQSLDSISKALAVNEQIIFENKELHDFFYNHILWKEEDQGAAGGFYIKTLEFLPHQLKGVKLFKNWFILKILNKIVGVSKMIVKENAEKYAKSGTMGILAVSGHSDEDFVNAGRAAERVWITATKLGLSLHPCTGVIYLWERIAAGDTKSFSKEHLKIINNAFNDIVSAFGVKGKTAPMLFRIGFADEPTARSSRLRIDDVIRFE